MVKCNNCKKTLYKIYSRPSGKWVSLKNHYYCNGCDVVKIVIIKNIK